MRMNFERLLNLAAATVTLASAFGLDGIDALSMAAISVGLALLSRKIY
jgi:hypothetical protein